MSTTNEHGRRGTGQSEGEHDGGGNTPVSDSANVAADVGRDGDREMTRQEMIEEALNCPCIAKMKEGSCGEQFVAAYRCFLESDEDPKGLDCLELFTTMQSCIAEHPDEYDFGDADKSSFPEDVESSVDTPTKDDTEAMTSADQLQTTARSNQTASASSDLARPTSSSDQKMQSA